LHDLGVREVALERVAPDLAEHDPRVGGEQRLLRERAELARERSAPATVLRELATIAPRRRPEHPALGRTLRRREGLPVRAEELRVLARRGVLHADRLDDPAWALVRREGVGPRAIGARRGARAHVVPRRGHALAAVVHEAPRPRHSAILHHRRDSVGRSVVRVVGDHAVGRGAREQALRGGVPHEAARPLGGRPHRGHATVGVSRDPLHVDEPRDVPRAKGLELAVGVPLERDDVIEVGG
jgi:hypothetical protein